MLKAFCFFKLFIYNNYMKKIELEIDKISDLHSPYSNNDIHNDVFAFIDEKINYIPLKEELEIDINCKKPATDTEKTIAIHKIKSYYEKEINITYKDIKRYRRLAITLLLCGLVLLAGLHFLNKLNPPFFLFTFLDIVAWVFIWEFVETIIFRSLKERSYKKKCQKIIDSNININ